MDAPPRVAPPRAPDRAPRHALSWLLALLLSLAAAGCDVPRDAQGTSERLRGGGPLRVGVAAAEPFAVLHAAAEPSGPEPDLARRFATELGTGVTWTEGPAHALVAALERGELDLVFGGLTRGIFTGPAVSRPWIRTRVTLGTRDDAAPDDRKALRGMAVRASRGSLAADLARRGGAAVEEVDRLGASDAPVVAQAWEIEALDLHAAAFTLHRTPRTFLARGGENGFLMALDRFLHGREGWARERLVAAAARDDPNPP